jgi:hypothetical protein
MCSSCTLFPSSDRNDVFFFILAFWKKRERERERERLVHFQMTMSPQFKKYLSTKQEKHHEHNWINQEKYLFAYCIYAPFF